VSCHFRKKVKRGPRRSSVSVKVSLGMKNSILIRG